MMTSLPELTFQTSPDIEGTPNQKHPSVLVGGSTVVLCWWPQNCKTCMETGCFHGPVPHGAASILWLWCRGRIVHSEKAYHLHIRNPMLSQYHCKATVAEQVHIRNFQCC